MKNRVFIIHGWDGYPEEGWFPWLKRELETRGFEVYVPAMPNSAEPKIDVWVPFLAQQIGKPDENLYLVGHSIGCQTILRYLESIDKKIGGAVCVAGWIIRLTGDLTSEDIEIAKPWIETPIVFQKIKHNTSHITAIFSNNDPFVTLENINEFKNKLGAQTVTEHDKGHFSGSDGITELPSALNAILEMAK